MTTGFQSPTGVGIAPAHWQDTGCGGECTSSLNCPHETCKLDEPEKPTVATDETVERYQRVWKMRKAGIPIQEIKRQVGISRRTVLRIMQNGGVPKRTGPKPVSDLSTERPLIDPCKFAEPFAKPYPKTGPAFGRRLVHNYRRACPRPECSGTVRVDFTEKTATCLACGRDARR